MAVTLRNKEAAAQYFGISKKNEVEGVEQGRVGRS